MLFFMVLQVIVVIIVVDINGETEVPFCPSREVC